MASKVSRQTVDLLAYPDSVPALGSMFSARQRLALRGEPPPPP
jgi:hypothetical protein